VLPALQIHWFSIINSCVTVLLLTGFLATILMRVLKNDFLKYSRDEEAGACSCCCSCRMYMLLFVIS
jgi:Endomembrane protein 70